MPQPQRLVRAWSVRAGAARTQVEAGVRARRWLWFRAAFPDIERLRVVDLGGSTEFWLHAPVRPAHVRVVTDTDKSAELTSWLTCEAGDPLATSGSCDVVVCDGLLDRLAAPADRATLADVVHALGERYWVRASARAHPLDPQTSLPAVHLLPDRVRSRIGGAAPDVFPARRAELTARFPGAVVRGERVAGLVASYVVAKPRADHVPGHT
ncbi:hypothetical protein [Streptomyces sp. SID3343]|uniref:hypothetical protein n=1 Tax=Streptomyces sp. SID3343 TaxID=2690260 RepID=UPI00136F62B1|nr:hypothetical protein [Streptomyces sp. SID3343]MYW04430.1 hypothetical protein [Streptomyces sp. SID3343]